MNLLERRCIDHESGKQAYQVKFEGKLKLEFHGTTIGNDAGLLVYRELDGLLA